MQMKMKKLTKSDKVLFKLELEMRRAEAEGDAIMVAYYSQLIEDFTDAMNEVNDPPILRRLYVPPET
jgi:hypothetical protein